MSFYPAVVSPRFAQYVDYPSHVRGPNYTRYVFKEYGPYGNFQLHPMINNGVPLAGEAEQRDFVQYCMRLADDEVYCSEMSRAIANGTITLDEANCEVECWGKPASKARGKCFGSCYGGDGLSASTFSNPLVIGGLVLAAALVVHMVRK